MKALKHPFYIRGNREGCLTLEPQGDRSSLSIFCNDDEAGIYRGVLYGEKGRLSLGTLIPKDGKLILHCVLPNHQLESIGAIEKGEAILSYPASSQSTDLPGWRREPTPERLFDDPVLMEAAKRVKHAWIRQENGVLFLALPWEREFPLLPLFCFAQIMLLEKKRYAVFALDSRGMPVA